MFSLAAAIGGCLLVRCTGFSVQRLPLAVEQGSGAHGFSSCGAGLGLPRGMWGIPGPGIETSAPALAGGFLTREVSLYSILSEPVLRRIYGKDA